MPIRKPVAAPADAVATTAANNHINERGKGGLAKFSQECEIAFLCLQVMCNLVSRFISKMG